ncbi:MAG TPA: HEAT repeat domain-containing protein [Bryobacteraceae bacterium]|jgi:hypothetical protein|nr:HEAT repeat domain-containing protein [Bryobacteraceae bacterium]
MKRFHGYLLAAAALPAFAQTPEVDAARAQADTARAQLDALQAQLAPLRSSMPAFQKIATGIKPYSFGSSDFDYDNGMRSLDNRQYEKAIQSFDRVVTNKAPRAEGALYWKAYGLNRLGRRDDSLAAIAVLRRDYPKSRWLNDAQALEVEVRQSSGKPISPADESNEDLKLIAINGLLSADPEHAVPLLEGILKGTAAPPVKDRAMFVLAQSQSPRAQQVLTDYAKGNGNPDLQVRAVHYMGIAGTQERLQMLISVYSTTTDTTVKRAVVQALFIAGAADKLVDLARKERDLEMKKAIVQQLSMMGGKEATDYMLELLK